MKYKFINQSSYTLGKYNLKFGDTIDSNRNLHAIYPHLFILDDVKTPKKKKKFVVSDKLSVKQLQELAKKYNIIVEKGLDKKSLINKIISALPNE